MNDDFISWRESLTVGESSGFYGFKLGAFGSIVDNDVMRDSVTHLLVDDAGVIHMLLTKPLTVDMNFGASVTFAGYDKEFRLNLRHSVQADDSVFSEFVSIDENGNELSDMDFYNFLKSLDGQTIKIRLAAISGFTYPSDFWDDEAWEYLYGKPDWATQNPIDISPE